MSPMDLLTFITGDLPPKDAKEVRQALLKLGWRIGMLFFVAMSLGMLTAIGISGFARASDVDQKLAPITAQLTRQSASIDQLVHAQQEQTVQLLRASIIDLQVKKCKAKTDDAKEIYRKQQEDQQSRYYALKGDYLQVPACADL